MDYILNKSHMVVVLQLRVEYTKTSQAPMVMQWFLLKVLLQYFGDTSSKPKKLKQLLSKFSTWISGNLLGLQNEGSQA